MDQRDFVLELIDRHRCKVCAEIGVWKGELSRKIMETGVVETLYMVDPLKHELNLFAHSSAGPQPTKMKPGTYQCDMGQPVLSQEELDRVYDEILEEMARYGDRVRFIRKTSAEAGRDVPDESLDLVFIDAVHLYENVKEDIETWLPKVKSTGIISGDDYHREYGGVIAAVNERFPRSVLRVNRAARVWYVMKSEYLRPERSAARRILRWFSSGR